MAKKSDTAILAANPYKPSKEEQDRENEWRIKADMRTLSEAEEIKADKSRHEAAKKMASAEMEKIAAVAGAEPKDTTEKTTTNTKVESKSGDNAPRRKESIDAFMKRRDGK